MTAYTVFTLLSTLVMAYLVMIFIRVMATWFGQASDTPFIRFLAKATDPWLGLFRSWRFLRFNLLDMTPIAAIAVLVMLNAIFMTLARYQALTLSLVLQIVCQVLGGSIQSIIATFGLIALARLIGLLARASSVQQLWFALDHLLQPLIYPIMARLSPRRVMPYGTGLGIFVGLLVVLWVLVGLLFGGLSYLCTLIPY